MGAPAGIGWLHLSTLLVDQQGGLTTRSEIRELLEQDLRRVHAVSGPWDLVAICGNITRNGDAEEFDRAGQVVEWLWTVLHRLGSEPSLVLVPDVTDRGLVFKKRSRAYLVDERNAPRREETDELTRVASQLAEFARFSARQREDLRPRHVRSGMLPGDSSLDIDRNGLRVGVLGLNTSVDRDQDDQGKRIAAACGADPAEWTRRSDAVIIVAPDEDALIAGHFADQAVPLVWLCSQRPQALTMRSRGGRTYLVVSAPQLYGPTEDTFGYSAGRLWVSDDQTHARVWHRCLTGDQELRRMGPPQDAIVDRDGAVTLLLPARGAPCSAGPPRSTPAFAALARSAVVDHEAALPLAQPSSADPSSSARVRPQADEMQIRDLAWSPDGQRIAAISGPRTLVLYDRGRIPIAQAMIPGTAPAAIAWSPDGDRIATRSRSHVHIWTVDGAQLRGTELSCPAPAAMAWTASGELALGCDDGAYLWTPVPDRDELGNAVQRIQKTADPVLALAVSQRHRIAAAGGRPWGSC